MASNNNHNNNNQPRRKRNKKPVKRYSEEYNNRPNPYTGYSSDGNYHPEAKKRSIEKNHTVRTSESGTSASTDSNASDRNYDYSRSAMTDAVWPPPSESRPKSDPESAPAEANKFASARSDSAREPQKPAEKYGEEEVQHDSGDIADLEETAAKLENKAGSPNSNGTSHRKSGSHRKKHTNRQYSEADRRAKMEAKRAAVDKIAQGVEAHSVSEQMIDDISNMSKVIEGMSKEENAKRAGQSDNGGGVNWEEIYDAAFPPKEQEPIKEEKKSRTKKRRIEFDEVSEQSEPMPVKPVVLGEDEALPYDLIVEENAREAEEAKARAEASADTPAQNLQQEAGSFKNPPLAPSDLIPVLDFEKPANGAEAAGADSDEETEKTADAADSEEDSVGAGQDTIDDVSGGVSIEEIIGAIEREKLEASKEAASAVFAAGLPDFALGDMNFETDKSEGWHEIAPPPLEDTDSQTEQGKSEHPKEDDSVSLLSERLMQSYMELEDQPLEYIPDDGTDQDFTEQFGIGAEPTETVDLNRFFEPTEVVEPTEVDVEVTVVPEETIAETSGSVESLEPEKPSDTVAVDIDISEIEDDIFAETDISNLEEENIAEETADDSSEDAVKEKIEKLVEAAELAEVLRQESEDSSATGVQSNDDVDIFSVVVPAEGDSQNEFEQTVIASEEEVIREYQPHKNAERHKDDNVFESVLIVDDSRGVVDSEAAQKQDDTQFLHSVAVENPTAVFQLPDDPILLPPDMDDTDFREHWLDEDEDGDEMATRTKRARRRISAFIGGVAILFVVMVVVSVLSTVVTGFSNIGSTNEKKLEYSEFITPVVMNDPAPFETIDKADNQMLLESSIWRVLGEMSATEDYEYTYDATRKIVISADDVAKAGRQLFGSEVELNMNVLSESDGSAIYYYDSVDNSFHISTGGVLGPSPVITKMAQKSDYVSLVVGYVDGDEMSLTSSDDEVECYKYMEYVLALNPDQSYYIQSIRDYVEE